MAALQIVNNTGIRIENNFALRTVHFPFAVVFGALTITGGPSLEVIRLGCQQPSMTIADTSTNIQSGYPYFSCQTSYAAMQAATCDTKQARANCSTPLDLTQPQLNPKTVFDATDTPALDGQFQV